MFNQPAYKQRRTATSVFAGEHDTRPSWERDVLTTLLNGVPKYHAVEKAEEESERRAKKKEKKEREAVQKPAKALPKVVEKPLPVASSSSNAPVATKTVTKRAAPVPRVANNPSSFWQARPAIHISSVQRSVSVTPPPMPSSPPSTPGPSISSSTSRNSSKRLQTPFDDEDLAGRGRSRSRSRSVSTFSSIPRQMKQRKKRVAVRKGWKGWIEGSPKPSEKLINLDSVTVLRERTTRSGRNFDAIGEKKDFWI
ncbi:hypothetical protein PHLCEN_2v7610 [Hermanssonia centrifuga]|uniref:Uncharacterized protein n=1 Tax=Hermanssonia centrifuga TaxID=98765 RepID=A0A2R6NWL0_9APHY|nr:hypothetical protein PHLCEN_2v7610 [Hermanssonia centrifuga]